MTLHGKTDCITNPTAPAAVDATSGPVWLDGILAADLPPWPQFSPRWVVKDFYPDRSPCFAWSAIPNESVSKLMA